MRILDNLDFIDIFEQHLADYTKFKYAVCVDCCTNGILLSLELLRRNGIVSKQNELSLTKYTYMSVPMTLVNNGWKVHFIEDKWSKFYQISHTKVFDAATDLHEYMRNDYTSDDCLVCISFQQKKRLALGRGGCILTDNEDYSKLLKRLRYDGRNPYISDNKEIKQDGNSIICGYHCYMEPAKAAVGIQLLNQPNCLPSYVEHSWKEYEDLSRLNIWTQH